MEKQKTDESLNAEAKAATGPETTVFRQKNLEKATAPEQLDGYLKVTGFGPWFVILAAACVLAAVFTWAFFGKIHTSINGAGYCQSREIVCYFAQNEIKDIPKGATVDVGSSQGTVTEIESDLYRAYDIPNEVLFLLPDSEWYSTARISCDMEDGLYSVAYHEEARSFASFMTQRD